MNTKLRKIVTLLLALIFVISTGLLIRSVLDAAKSADSYESAEAIAQKPRETEAITQTEAKTEPEVTEPVPAESEATEPIMVWVPAPVEEDEYMKKLQDTNLDALREVNSDVVGWIFIPSCRINYPIVQGDDNQHYLDYTWDNRKSHAGAIFMESTNRSDFQDFRTIIYGHNMADSTMFGSLYRFENQPYWKNHPYVYLVTDEGVLRYEIYSSYRADVESGTYALNLNAKAYRLAFIRLTKEEAIFESSITPDVTDRLLTLSTCAGNATTRRVVHARLPMIQVEMKMDSPQ